jgi:hypothetical protein
MTDKDDMIRMLAAAGITTPHQLRQALDAHQTRKEQLTFMQEHQGDLIQELEERGLQDLAIWASVIVNGKTR